ncbi:glycosyltransferase family 2 protein [Pontibacter silvestris]|uniref:Glycosyltransferase family 2 protein n=1 Tax=Pontibacter silvestris TaxID=2305183 RepID=A0ABW4WVS7_9BACT|nr:glycosyltransferase family 2 protein [Pontibacter silvestris]MCC9137338.1 glycosyltransferase family 2 protein [Pontibacter silvestris]
MLQLISVVIPCYNVANYIKDCVESVLKQTYINIEVICVDNNSTDQTYTILNELKSHYSQLVVTSELKRGACAARNKGLYLAKGQWVQFLDADDLLLPKKIEEQHNLLQGIASPVSFIAGSYIRRFVNGVEKKIISHNRNPIVLGVAINSLGITSANLFNREKLLQVEGWNEEISSSQESDLMFRLIKIEPNVIIDTVPLTIVRERISGSISQTNLDENIVRYIKLRLQILDYLVTIRASNNDRQLLMQVIFDKIRELYNYNPSKSLEMYKNNIPEDFKPQVSATTTKGYLYTYNLFGFKSAQKLKSFLNRIKK